MVALQQTVGKSRRVGAARPINARASGPGRQTHAQGPGRSRRRPIVVDHGRLVAHLHVASVRVAGCVSCIGRHGAVAGRGPFWLQPLSLVFVSCLWSPSLSLVAVSVSRLSLCLVSQSAVAVSVSCRSLCLSAKRSARPCRRDVQQRSERTPALALLRTQPALTLSWASCSRGCCAPGRSSSRSACSSRTSCRAPVRPSRGRMSVPTPHFSP